MFKLINISAVVQTRGKDMSAAITVDHVIPQEYGNISLDKFQTIISTGQASNLFEFILSF